MTRNTLIIEKLRLKNHKIKTIITRMETLTRRLGREYEDYDVLVRKLDNLKRISNEVQSSEGVPHR
jgi:hypothetical protein